jgi:hypothetical protein
VCCEARVIEDELFNPATSPDDMTSKEACITLQAIPPGTKPGAKAFLKKLSAVEIDDAELDPPPVLCEEHAENSPLVASSDNAFSWQILECGLNGQIDDPDSNNKALKRFEWYTCANDEAGTPKELITSSSVESPYANVPGSAIQVPIGEYICCSVQLCDIGDENNCSTALKLSGQDALYIHPTPIVLPQPTIQPGDLNESEGPLGEFRCEVSSPPIDCDNPGGDLDISWQFYLTDAAGVLNEPITGFDAALAQSNPDWAIFSYQEQPPECGEHVACEVQVSVESGNGQAATLFTSELSTPFEPKNTAPNPTQITMAVLQSNGTFSGDQARPIDIIQCEWGLLSDPELQDIDKIVVNWFRNGEKLGDKQQTIESPEENDYATLSLGNCEGPDDAASQIANPGDTLTCSIELFDACGESTIVESTGISQSSISIVENDVAVTLSQEPDAAPLAELEGTGDANSDVTCKLNQSALQYCNKTTDPDKYEYTYALIVDGVPTLEITQDGLQQDFATPLCTDNKAIHCTIEVHLKGAAPGSDPAVGPETSNIIVLQEGPPEITSIAIAQANAIVGDTLDCLVEFTDPDNDAEATISWLKNGDVIQGANNNKLQLTSENFTENNQVQCTVSVEDTCQYHDKALESSNPLIIGNSPATFGSVVLSPEQPQANEVLTCKAGQYSDPDLTPIQGYTITWESLDGDGNWIEINDFCDAQTPLPTTEGSLTLANCSDGIPKETTIRCIAVPFDDDGEGLPTVSNEVTIQDSEPFFSDSPAVSIVVDPSGTALPSAPTLSAGQGELACEAPVTDIDGDPFDLEFTWLLDGVKISGEESETIDLEELPPGSVLACQEIQCGVALFADSGEVAQSGTSESVDIRGGGSLCFTSESSDTVLIGNSSPAAAAIATPAAGILELWYFPTSLPSGGTRDILVSGEGAGPQADQTWELAIDGITKRPRLRIGNNFVDSPANSIADLDPLEPEQWNFIALSWNNNAGAGAGNAKIHVLVPGGASGETLFNEVIPIDLQAMTLGSGGNQKPSGCLDEMHVRLGAFPDPKDGVFDVTAQTLAVYDFALHNTEGVPGSIAVDKGPNGFHGTSDDLASLASYHAQVDGCSQQCDPTAGEGCVTSPASVEISVPENFSIPAGTNPSPYEVQCTASGAFDLNLGAIATYSYEWVKVQGNQTLADVDNVGQSALKTILIAEEEGCFDIVCRATPQSPVGGIPGPSMDSPAVTICYAGEQTIFDFGCEDNNPCTLDDTGPNGCEHAFFEAGECNVNCPDPSEEPKCVDGFTPQCGCENPCEPSDNPCIVVEPNGAGECVENAVKQNGANCTDGNECTTGNGECSNGTCVGAISVDCDDDNPCTKDDCNPASGCAYSFNTDDCDDDDACTLGDQCAGGFCSPSGAVDCEDGNVCTGLDCDEVAGCLQPVLTNAPCSDGSACTGDGVLPDLCGADASCTPGALVICDLGSPDCRTAVCDVATGCEYTPVEFGTACEDGDACTLGDFCSGITCQPGFTTDCDDGDQCTADACEKNNAPGEGCSNDALTGTACDDGNACSQVESCLAGFCTPTAETECVDGNPCTPDDQCDPLQGCQFIANSNILCDDGDACTGDAVQADQCDSNGVCVPGPTLVCDDANPCTSDSCETGIGCVNVANADPCEDGSTCTLNDFCLVKTCQPGADKVCNDGNPCTTDDCDPLLDCQTVDLEDGSACGDGDPCTISNTCAAGLCDAGVPEDCDDGNFCTSNTCESSLGGCQNPFNTNPCDDGIACTTDDECSIGDCVGEVNTCADGNECTADACLADGSCSNAPIADGTVCSDGNACTDADGCVSGGATSNCIGDDIDCDDDNECTADTCAPVSGCLNTAVTDGDTCDDELVCTGTDGQPDKCVAGTCAAGANIVCLNTNQCTLAECNEEQGGCVSVTLTGQVCDDGNLCTTAETCQVDASCKGDDVTCTDGNVCTEDQCDPFIQCVFPVNTALTCSDGNSCTKDDGCFASGACLGTDILTAGDCNDGNVCTVDGCDVDTGCVNPPSTDPCNDGNACTQTDTCDESVCVGVNLVDCDDANECTADACDTTTGSCSNNPILAQACDDGEPCTTASECDASGACVGTNDLLCNDGVDCTDDSCNGDGNCIFANNSASCDDGAACTHSDTCSGGGCSGTGYTCNDNNGCTDDSCNGDGNCTFANNSASCNDGQSCTHTDTCSGGGCSGTGYTCNDGNVCTDDFCTGNGGCGVNNNGVGCNDGNACTQTDTCDESFCVGANPVDCDDANECTADACDTTTGSCSNNPIVAQACDDGEPCTTASECDASGACIGTNNLLCNDGVDCTSDSCLNGTGCQFSADDAQCDDDATCTSDSCDAANGCVFIGDNAACNDGVACTDDACAGTPGGDGCAFTPADANCDDGFDCTADSCDPSDDGADLLTGCLADADDLLCDDLNPCTDDFCDASAGDGCSTAVVADPAATACDDGDANTTSDVCHTDGTCLGAPFFCDGAPLAGCGFSSLVSSLDASGSTSYSGSAATCDDTVTGGSTAQCLEPSLGSDAEICVDFFDFDNESSATGFAGLLEDTESTVAPDQCVEGLLPPNCVPIAVPAGQHLLALQGDNPGAQEAQIHIRCPGDFAPLGSCDNGEQGHPTLDNCEDLVSCTYPDPGGNNKKFTSIIDHYGGCGDFSGKETRYEVFLDPAEARTLWLRAIDENGADITNQFTLAVAPTQGSNDKCKQHNDGSKKCFRSSPSPLHIPTGNDGAYNSAENYCVFLELDPAFAGDETKIEITLSVGCY